MKKKSIFKLVILFVLSFIFINADAQEWRYINTYQGVEVYWRYRKELAATKYICELKLENTNNYKVEVSFKARFLCADGNEYLDAGNSLTVGANASKAGQFSGLWWYPCDDGRAPDKGGYRDMSVKRAD